MDLFFTQLRRPQSLLKVLSIDLTENGNFIAVLQKGLINLNLNANGNSKKQLEDIVDTKLSHLKIDHGTRFNILITSYLDFVYNVDPWSTWDNIDIIFEYYTCLNNFVISMNTKSDDSSSVDFEYHVCKLYQKMTKYVIRLSGKLDSLNTSGATDRYLFSTQVTILLSKYFQNIKPMIFRDSYSQIDSIYGDTEDAGGSGTSNVVSYKFKILLWVVNRLNNLFFSIKSPKSSYTIFNNMSHKIDTRVLVQQGQSPMFNMIDVLEYRYLLGRSYMVQNKVVDSFYQLNECFHGLQKMIIYYNTIQPQDARMHEKLVSCLNKTFKILIPMGLIIGKIPYGAMSQVSPYIDHKLVELYQPLMRSVTSGNLSLFSHWISRNKLLLIHENMYLLLIDKIPLLIIRNCIKKIFENYCLPDNSNKLGYDVIEYGLNMSINNSNQGNKDQILETMFSTGISAEVVLSTLISYNWLKGNIFPMSKVLLTMKSNNINDIFPSINEKIMQRFPLQDSDSWLDHV